MRGRVRNDRSDAHSRYTRRRDIQNRLRSGLHSLQTCSVFDGDTSNIESGIYHNTYASIDSRPSFTLCHCDRSLLPRVTRKTTVSLAGSLLLPPIVGVSVALYVLHYDPQVYTLPSARHLSWWFELAQAPAAPEKRDRRRKSGVTFRSGYRIRIGRDLAMFEIKRFWLPYMQIMRSRWSCNGRT